MREGEREGEKERETEREREREREKEKVRRGMYRMAKILSRIYRSLDIQNPKTYISMFLFHLSTICLVCFGTFTIMKLPFKVQYIFVEQKKPLILTFFPT